jgi:hypothetical protein
MKKIQLNLLRISGLALFIFLAGCECEPPIISSITPSSGPAGTIVEVVYTKGAISGKIIYEGSEVPTESASHLGLGKTLRFTIPYDAPVGNKNIEVSSAGTSPAVVFNVTATASVPTPVLNGFEIGDDTGKEITLYGSNFSTLSQVFIDGVEVDRYAGSSLPLRSLPIDMRDNAIICSPVTPLTLGSSYNVQVKNPDNTNSNILNITVPSRVLSMEFDAIDGVPVPDYYAWQNNTVNTLRRSYCDAGWIINLTYDDVEITDPFPGTEWSNADLYNFWVANANVPASGYYMHGQFIPDGPTTRGRMFMWTYRVPTIAAANIRQGYAVFWDDFSTFVPRQTFYLRTAIHESGHGFNLLHGDASASQTIMTTTGSLAAGWHMFYSNTSRDHLRNHNLTDVAPGGTDFGDATCH